MQHTKLQSPVPLSEWRAFLRAADPQVVFQDYRALFEGPATFGITVELNQIVEDFGPASNDAVYAVLGEEIYAVWIDPLHNYLAVVCSKAKGDPEDATLIMSYGKADTYLPRGSPSSTASGKPSPVGDAECESPDNVVTWESGPLPDLSDMDRVHEAAANGELTDIFTAIIAGRAPK